MESAAFEHGGNAASAATPGFRIFNGDKLAFPLLLSVPHAGRDYPQAIFDNLRVHPGHLVRLEDRYADRLATGAIAAGVGTIIATRARGWIDLNRGENELDPEMVDAAIDGLQPVPTAKMRGGLGLIPRRLQDAGELWKHRFSADDIAARLRDDHRSYHATIDQLLAAIADRFGTALLIDLHSMPPLLPGRGAPARIVIGDRFGQTAPSLYAEMLIERLKSLDLPVALNHPYAGDYVLRRHGNARKKVHAIQIEVDRSLYLDSALRECGPGLPAATALVTELLFLLADTIAPGALPLAAE